MADKARPQTLGVTLTYADPDRGLSSTISGVPRGEPVAGELGAGERIRQYEIIRLLGQGGMGRVYLARDTRLGRRVAIKVVMRDAPEFATRFLREARVTATCQHENIVVIHEVGSHDGLPYMVLEYLEGHALRDVVGERMAPGRLVELAVPIVRALAHAHALGIVHRDLKPANVMLTSGGAIKVLDFGIARVFEEATDGAAPGGDSIDTTEVTSAGGIVGTLPYMAPEQWCAGPVDARTDIWALGVMLYELLVGARPIEEDTLDSYRARVLSDAAMPRVADAVTGVPSELAAVIDRCMNKRAADRFADACAVLEALEPLLPGSPPGASSRNDNPYPGLSAFQQADADRFFGREREVARAVNRVRELPLLAIAGPSGTGKSSFVRAGVIPALERSGEPWEFSICRPGTRPLEALAELIAPSVGDREAVAARLRAEPGLLGAELRARAHTAGKRVLVLVDQLEELYTLTDDAPTQRSFCAALAGAADDASSPVRVIASIRSDFVHRVAADPRLGDSITNGLSFLGPLDRLALRDALTRPARLQGYELDSPDLVERMLDELQQTPGALPLLQFCAARLWDARDRERRLLTSASYDSAGGVGGTLSNHADEVVRSLSAPARGIARDVLLALVTPERTRQIVELSELEGLAAGAGELGRVLDRLVQGRLLVLHDRADGGTPAVELVHESLIGAWGTLRRWLDEGHDDAVLRAQLANAARQWHTRGRPAGLLWRGDAVDEARVWHRRYRGPLAEVERAYLDAAFAHADRAVRVKRKAVAATIGVLLALVAAAAVALVWIRGAEQEARRQADIATREAQRARAAEATAVERERARQAALHRADEASADADLSREQLRDANLRLQRALTQAEQGRAAAEQEQRRAQQAALQAKAAEERARPVRTRRAGAREQLEKALERERERVERLERERKKITTELR